MEFFKIKKNKLFIKENGKMIYMTDMKNYIMKIH